MPKGRSTATEVLAAVAAAVTAASTVHQTFK